MIGNYPRFCWQSQHRSLVRRIHSLGVHLSHNQKPHWRQHLQQQHEQHMPIISIKIVATTLPHVDVNTLKCWNLLACSLLIKSWTLLTFTLAKFNSSMEDKIFVRGFCNGIFCICSLSISVRQESKSNEARGNTSSLELFWVMVDNAYKVVCAEYPLHLGGK
jgi:hypothetical protein